MLSVLSCSTCVVRCTPLSSNHLLIFIFFLFLFKSVPADWQFGVQKKVKNQVFICKCLKEILASLCLFMLKYLKFFFFFFFWGRICGAPQYPICYTVNGSHSWVSASEKQTGVRVTAIITHTGWVAMLLHSKGVCVKKQNYSKCGLLNTINQREFDL